MGFIVRCNCVGCGSWENPLILIKFDANSHDVPWCHVFDVWFSMHLNVYVSD